MRHLITSTLAVVALCAPALAQVSAESKQVKSVQKAESAVSVPFNGNQTCPISGKPVKHSKFAEKDQRRIYTCCAKCKKKAAADFEKVYAEAYPADAVIELNNSKCPISGKAIDEPGATVVFQGHKISLCCKKCKAGFEENPRRYLALLKNPELKALNNKMCVVTSDEPVEPGSFFVYKNTLVDTCCADCADDFAADPKGYLAKFQKKAEKVKPVGEKKGG